MQCRILTKFYQTVYVIVHRGDTFYTRITCIHAYILVYTYIYIYQKYFLLQIIKVYGTTANPLCGYSIKFIIDHSCYHFQFNYGWIYDKICENILIIYYAKSILLLSLRESMSSKMTSYDEIFHVKCCVHFLFPHPWFGSIYLKTFTVYVH
jgi:hypothetical protein